MKNIKQLLLNFFEAESDAISKRRKPNLEEYNKAVEKMYSYTTGLLNEGLGIVSNDELDDEDYYEMYKDFPANNPSILFKLSHYKHPEFNDVWIGYSSSPTNDTEDEKILDLAYFVIKEDDKFVVARRYMYTDFEAYADTEVYEKEGLKMKWSASEGYSRLTFESLGELVAIERYQAPDDVSDSLQLYNEEK